MDILTVEQVGIEHRRGLSKMSVRIILSTQDENKLLEVLHSYAGLMQRKYNEIPFEESMNTEARRIKTSQDWAHALISQINGKFGRCDPEPYIIKRGKWVTRQIGFLLWEECDQCGAQVGTLGMNYCPNCGAKMEGETNDT